jgi:hypothetical protein
MKRSLGAAVPLALLLACHEDETPLAPTAPQTLQAATVDPAGFIEEPRIAGGFFPEAGSNLLRTLTFTGWVDFGPGEGEIIVEQDQFGNRKQPNPDPSTGNRPPLRIESAVPSTEARMIDGRIFHKFRTRPIGVESFVLFRWGHTPSLRLLPEPEPWPDGGTAKFYVYAQRSGESNRTRLRGRDRDGVKGKESGPSLVLADATFLLGEPKYLGRNKVEGNSQDTQRYYESVYATRSGKPAAGQTISERLATLKAFQAQYFNELAFGPRFCPSHFNFKVDEPPAVYFNKGDLGIGREMHCSFNFCTKETACYVRNFGDRDGNPKFFESVDEGKKETYEAIKLNKPFATVAMVSRGFMDKDEPNKVFFVVYDENDQLKTGDVALDNVGFNKFVPGNCIGCHGTSAKMNTQRGEILSAQFLPFDLQHGIDYYSAAGLSRADQEATFKELNRIVATTDLYTQAHARALLNGFYGAVRRFDVNASLVFNTWPSPKFKDDWVPTEWDTTSSPRQIYKRVIAPYCRTCHISDASASLDFGSHDGFREFRPFLHARLCGAGGTNIMPNAEITSHKFWASDARAQLVQRLQLANTYFPGCGSD